MVLWGLPGDHPPVPPTHQVDWRSTSMDSGGLCAMIPGIQQTQMLHVDSLDTLVLPILPAIAQAVMRGEMVCYMIKRSCVTCWQVFIPSCVVCLFVLWVNSIAGITPGDVTQEMHFTQRQLLLHLWMEGTEVPNPRRSSACDCTCMLIRNRTLSHDSLMLAMRIVLFLPMQSSLTSFWRSFTGLVQLIFSFPSWFHTIWFYCSHTFHS